MKINNHEIKMIIFDLDGTLIDSCGIWKQIDHNFFGKRNIPYPKTYGATIAHMGLEQTAIYTKETFGLHESIEEIMEEWMNESRHLYQNEIILKDGVKEFVELCHKENIPMVVATACDESCYLPCLKRNGIYDDFVSITDTRNYPQGKLTPDIYLDLAKKYGYKPYEVVVFEDIVVALKSAISGGFNTVAIYEKTTSKEDDEIKRTISDLYINSFNELLKYK
jgi:beta-phosphoglucomutase-like phosphatase (HAD superfamily)